MNLLKHILTAILTLESRLIIAKYKPFIVAVTGSVGKTSTKDAIYSVLKDSSKYVRKSEKSMNSEIGLPLTIIGMPNAWHSVSGWWKNIIHGLSLIIFRQEYPDRLILEIGADHPGDIKRVVRWLRPDIAVLTYVGETPVHVEFFSSPEEVFEEKAALIRGIRTGGKAILFADDAKIAALSEEVRAAGATPISFGLSSSADVRGADYVDSLALGIAFSLVSSEGSHSVKVKNIIGKTYMYPLLAAAAVGKACGMTMEDISIRLSNYEAPRSRMNILPGINNSTIIDDTYNSSPDAALAALRSLKELPGRKIVALGDMMELGKYSPEEHKKIGKQVVGLADLLITVGPRSRATADEALSAGFASDKVHSFDSATQAGAYLKPIISAGDVLLVKGSQSVRMERLVKILMNEPDKAADLIVRQEKEWLEKK